MNPYDGIILVLFFGLSLYLGFRYGSKIQSGKDYFLGNRNLPWWVLMISLVATETSTLTFLGIPALSYSGDYSFLSLAIGMVLGRILSAIFVLPLYSEGNYTSVYEWVGYEFGRPSQKTLSGLFAIIRVLADGVRLYAASLPLSYLLSEHFPSHWTFNQLSIVSLLILSVITILYSAYGGFRAVVWTDFLQFFIYTTGALVVLGLLIGSHGWEVLLAPNESLLGKLKIFHTEMHLSSGGWDPYYLFFSIPGGILLSLGSHGTDQMIVQRLLACGSLQDSRKALVGSGILVFLQFSIFLTIGSYLILELPGAETPNRVFSEYIVNHLPSPFVGLILAGVFASSMSTLSSTLNSLTLTTRVDWRWGTGSRHQNTLITVIWGILLLLATILLFFIDESIKSNIVEMGLAFASLVFGPMIALFFLKVIPGIYSPSSFRGQTYAALPILLGLGIGTTLGIHFALRPPFTLLVGTGILSFYSYYFLGRLLTREPKE